MTDPLSGSFGTETVSPEERRALIRRVFVEVAPRYDVMNDLMSFGIHRLWKRQFAALAAPKRGETVVDLAGGTGDVARLMAGSGARVVVVDPSTAMMCAGRRPDDALEFVAGEGERLPFGAGTIDCLTISFGIRNVTHLGEALTEIHRVLKPGGRFLCLEFSRPHAIIRPFYQAWSSTAIPALGAAIAGSPSAYRYLIESIRRFPDQPAFAHLIEQAGFAEVRWINLSFGIAAIHIATKRNA
ncbi:class I SAM-dependent methyltransferase [Blastochloris viridis]|uniref:Ubiquinone/menaquinone biosynthesis C-methyltransferase UbiE n=1 Tax=Blastochloris viridis TaxID=1079 RepID=A0A0H5BB89_BLAVI|nr:class I SAM-dependent methyltransferase [Blastochloris viridis]ALK08359.1 Ubiquinone/menaquinone biosynthesis C-methyltransferase UbiE [Blastochloris viridis]BAR98369.1 ubiquinone/menaquinone biosynthesis methyltransferase UbiE [Blastochloris viridis]CUU41021.1 Ubiquinone/menaquinone biosynthesis methyltransferase ubiE [Blastochloris viridis]